MCRLVLALLLLSLSFSLAMAGVVVVAPEHPTTAQSLACADLIRLTGQLTGEQTSVEGAPVSGEINLLVGSPDTSNLIANLVDSRALTLPRHEQGFVVKSLAVGGADCVALAGGAEIGSVYAVYEFLEQQGIGFDLGGEYVPAPRALVWEGLSLRREPAFGVRGSLPWYNFFDAPTTWNLEDYMVFIDNLVKQKQNFLGFHSYDFEPFGAWEDGGKLVQGGALQTTADRCWGTWPKATEAFPFGLDQLYEDSRFGASVALDASDNEDSILRAQALLAQAFSYAKQRGLRICFGYEATGDPFDPTEQARWQRRLESTLERYPELDYFWLWESEGLMTRGWPLPSPYGQFGLQLAEWEAAFSYLDSPEKRAEGVRLAAYAWQTWRLLKAYSPNTKLVLSGWGGDNWMHWSDLMPGLDKVVPKDVIFSALDDIRVGPKVSQYYGQLAPDRERWPCPWYEYDGDQWFPQPNVLQYEGCTRDALDKGCQGLLSIHWRTRGVAESCAYASRFAWQPAETTFENFYDDYSARLFGAKFGPDFAPVMRSLQRLGYRWVGGAGQMECGGFAWSDSDPAKRAELERLTADFQLLRDRLARAGEPLTYVENADYYLAWLDFALAFTTCSDALQAGGPVRKALQQASAYDAQADKNLAINTAGQAWELARELPFERFMRAYEGMVSSRGELGVIATYTTKAWVDLEQFAAKVGELTGKPPVAGFSLGKQEGVYYATFTPVAGARRYEFRGQLAGASDWARLPARAVAEGRYQVDFPRAGAWQVVMAPIFGNEAGFDSLPVSFTVGPEKTAPQILVAQRNKLWPTAARLPFFVRLVEDSDLAEVVFVSRGTPEKTWRRHPLTLVRGKVFACELPDLPVDQPIDYYLEATDEWGNTGYWPTAGAKAPATLVALAGQPTEARFILAPLGDRSEQLPAPLVTQMDQLGLLQFEWKSPSSAQVARYELSLEAPGEMLLTTSFLERLPWYGLTPGKEYTLGVKALSPVGEVLAEYAPRVFTAPALALPPAPTDLEALPGKGGVALRWGRAPFGVQGYEVWAAPKGQPLQLLSSQPLPAKLQSSHYYYEGGLTGGQPYQFQLIAVGAGGENRSAVVEATPEPRPEGPAFYASFDGKFEASIGAPSGAAGKLTAGRIDSAVRLDGTACLAWAPTSDTLPARDFSLSLWFKWDGKAQMPVIVSRGEWNHAGFFAQILGGRLRFHSWPQGDLDAGYLGPGQWYHLACTYDGHVQRVYLNGQLQGERFAEGLLEPASTPFYVGGYLMQSSEYFFDGLLDEVKLFHWALSPEEVQKEYTTQSP